jgi:hypothetical protein
MTSLKVKFLIAKANNKLKDLQSASSAIPKGEQEELKKQIDEQISMGEFFIKYLEDFLANPSQNFDIQAIAGVPYRVLSSAVKKQMHDWLTEGKDEKLLKFLNYQPAVTYLSSDVPGNTPPGISRARIFDPERDNNTTLGDFSRVMWPTRILSGEYWGNVWNNIRNQSTSRQDWSDSLKESLRTQINLNVLMPLGFKYGLPAKLVSDTFATLFGSGSVKKLGKEDIKYLVSLLLFRFLPIYWYDQAFKDLENGNVFGFYVGIALANMFTTEGGKNSSWGRFLRLDERCH